MNEYYCLEDFMENCTYEELENLLCEEHKDFLPELIGQLPNL